MIKTDALDRPYKFTSEAYSGTKQSLPKFCRSKLFSWATDNNDFPDKEFAIVLVSQPFQFVLYEWIFRCCIVFSFFSPVVCHWL